jgi:hypothetical protein
MEIKMNTEYFWKRTDGWNWDGVQRWWEIFVVPLGFNGGGGWWIKEIWRWNNSQENTIENIKTLSWQESAEILDKLTQEATDGHEKSD